MYFLVRAGPAVVVFARAHVEAQILALVLNAHVGPFGDGVFDVTVGVFWVLEEEWDNDTFWDVEL
jgi:hypothetical protein